MPNKPAANAMGPVPLTGGLSRFVLAYIKSMRLYYAFITGIAGWIGVSFYQFCMPAAQDHARNAAILAILFLSWGVNQIINDYLDRKSVV